MPFSTPTCYQRAALLRSPPIPPKPRPTACPLPTTRDPTEPMCSGPVFHAEGHRLAMCPTGSRIAAIPSIWLGWLPRQRLRSIPDTADHLEIADALLLTVWLVFLSTNVGLPTSPFSRLPWPEPSRLYQTTNGTSRPAFQFTHQRNLANDDFSVVPQPQQTQGLSLPTQLFSYPPINRTQTPNGHSAFLDDTTTDELPNQGSPALARRCFRLHRLSHIHLGSPPRRTIPQWVVLFFLRYVSFFSNHRPIFPLPVNTEQFIFNPTVPNPPSVPNGTSAIPIPQPPFASETL